MRKIIILSFLFLFFNSNAQIISDDENEASISKNNLNESISEFYIGIAPTYTYRVLTENEGLFGGEIGDRVNEEGTVISSFTIGFRNSISKTLLLDFGVGISRNREIFSIDEPDSLFEYTNTYRHISFPAKIAYSTNSDAINFYGGLGLTPKAFLSRKKELRYREPGSTEQNETFFDRDGFNSMLIDATASLGLRINDVDYGAFILLEGAYQLNSNFDNQSPLHRNPFGIGVNFGLHFFI